MLVRAMRACLASTHLSESRLWPFGLAAVLLVVLWLSPAPAGQPEAAGRTRPTAATLPESNEALLLSSGVEEAIRAGNYRLAVELIDRLLDLPGGLVAAPASRTYYPVWRQRFRLLDQLPEPGVELYRQLHDAEVSARFEEAVRAADVSTLRELFRGGRLSSAWRAIGGELTAHLLDRGAYGEALEVLRELSWAGKMAGQEAGAAPEGGDADASPDLQAQLVVALAGTGAVHPAQRLLTQLQADPNLQAQPEWRGRLEAMNRWLTALRAEPAASADPGTDRFTPPIASGPVWAQTLPDAAREQLPNEEREIAQAVAALRRLPLPQAVLARAADGPLLVVRQHDRLWAIDGDTLMPRWSASESVGTGAGAGGALSSVAPEGGLRLSPDAQALMSDHLRHAVSVGFGKVYTVEGRAPFGADRGAFGQPPFAAARESVHRNELVARELDSGRVVWRTAAEPAQPLFDVAFQNVPTVVGDTLVAPIVRGKELRLAVLDPTDGHLISEVPLVGPPNRFSDEGGRCLMVSDETTLYVCTGNGVVAALARDDLSWKWATAYPSTLAEHLGQLWWQPQKTEKPGSIDPPVIADELLVVAPVDSDPPAIFALDRFSGRERWRMARREYPFLIGAVHRGLVVAGHALACLDLNDPIGRPPRWKSVPLEITGRSVIRDEHIYVPTRDGIVVLDGRTGKVLADQLKTDTTRGDAAAAVPDRAANLLVGEQALFSVSPSRVVKYPDLRRTRARCAAETTGEHASDRTTLVLAWLDALDRRYDEALARLQTHAFGDPRYSAAHDRLLNYVFLGLARDATPGEDRLGWLQRALALADSPQSAARLAITIGRVLEEDGRWPAALGHYGDLLYRPGACMVVDTADADRCTAAWVHAAERIRAICGEAAADGMEELIRAGLRGSERGEDPLINLQRLRVALANEPLRERIDWLLSLQELSPELKLQYLPEVDAPGLPIELRRRLHLERWDVHVSLGLLDAAREDGAIWQARFAQAEERGGMGSAASGGEAVTPLSAEEERERVEAVALALRKLEQAGGPPFTPRFVRQWKMAEAELVLDGRRPLTGLRAWILVADLANRRIALINAYKYEHPQRQTEDGMVGGKEAQSETLRYPAETLRYPAGEASGRGWRQGLGRETWPVVVYEHLAAVPAGGGLVGVGLGPERYGGRRQWECAVPGWEEVPGGFVERSVAGRWGVYFTPRQDRVALLGWFDGQPWWQRELPGVRIERLHLSGERLVIVADDQRVWVTDATFGRELHPVATGATPPHRVDVVGETIVVWAAEGALGIDSQTREQVWTRAGGPTEDSVTVPQRPWIAYRLHGDREWYLLNVRDGQAVFDRPLGVFDGISAIVADRDQLLVAGRAADVGTPEGGMRVTAIGLADGVRRWSREFATRVTINATQLAAHPDYIPILLAGESGDREPPEDTPLPAIQLVSKRDGEATEPFSVKEDYRPAAQGTCEMYMLVTPTRMIVQAGGNLIAYGNSPLRPTP